MGTSGVKLETDSACITIPIMSKSSSHLKQRILQGVICVQSSVMSLFSWKCSRDIAELCASKHSVLLSQQGNTSVCSILHSHVLSHANAMSKEDRLTDSNVMRVDPDNAVEQNLVEIKELLLNGVLRLPSISNEGHHLDQHGGMATHTDTPSQTNNLTRGKICHLKQKEGVCKCIRL